MMMGRSSLQFFWIMQQECQNGHDLSVLINSLTSHNIHLILAFLDSDTIINIIQAGRQQLNYKCKFISIASTKNFILNYLNKTDRSIYMPFYAQPLIEKIEHQQMAHITTYSSSGLLLLSNSCSRLFQRLRAELSGFNCADQAIQSIIQSLTDPELPFPKLRKQTQGMHCNSAFQFFLLEKLFSNQQEEGTEQTFEELRRYLNQRQDICSFYELQEFEIIQQVFSSWFKISYQNYENYLLHGRTHHNLIVLIVALLDFITDTYSFYVQSIQDSFYYFIEFNLRFSIFRNILLSLEGKLGFLFKSYSSFCMEMLEKKRLVKMEIEGVQNSQAREMAIWHCGLSKWYIYMQHLHEQHFKTFFYFLKKMNLKKIKQNNYEHMKENEIFIELQNRLELNEVDLLDRQSIFEFHSPLEDIFDENPQLYSQVIKEYIEYVVDISINEYSVHWCGHSSHVLHVPYQRFQVLLIQNYKTYLGKFAKMSKIVSNPAFAIDCILKSMIEQLDRQYLKPVTLRKIIDLIQSKAIIISGDSKYNKSQLNQTLKLINQEITIRDQRLDHFNMNSGISNEINYKYSIVLDNEDFNKLLKASGSTNASNTCRGHHLNMNSMPSGDWIMQEDFP